MGSRKADKNGGFFLRSVNAEYGGNKNQYIEYYNTFTTFGKKEGSSADAYLMYFYPAKEGVQVETDTVLNVAQWAGNANYEEAGVQKSIVGDLYKTNDMLDTDAKYTAVVSGKEVLPYTKQRALTRILLLTIWAVPDWAQGTMITCNLHYLQKDTERWNFHSVFAQARQGQVLIRFSIL